MVSLLCVHRGLDSNLGFGIAAVQFGSYNSILAIFSQSDHKVLSAKVRLSNFVL